MATKSPTKTKTPAKAAKKTVKKASKRPMSDEHKAALSAGRREGRAVREYLEALKGADGRSVRNPEALTQRLQDLQAKLQECDNPVKELELHQAVLDTEDQLAAAANAPDLDALQKDFIDVALPYSQRKGISYSAWRATGVPAAVLKEAGVPRTRRA